MGADVAIVSSYDGPFRMENIRITLETLYDILRNEKKKEDLQKLDTSFFIDVVSYLREKQALVELKREGENIFAAGDKEKLEYELRSIRRILKELYEKREKKILEIALNKSRTGSDIIDTSSMLREEKEFYTQILQNLDQFRRGVLLHLFRGELPQINSSGHQIELSLEQKKEQIRAEIERKYDPDAEKPAMIKIKFIHPTPSFVWKDMKVYGPYQREDQTEIFPEVAELLIRKGRAEKIE